MNRLQAHLRNAFLAGILGFLPLAVTIFIIFWIDGNTRSLSNYVFGKPIPGVGILLAVALIYVTGLLATTLLGKLLLQLIDAILRRVPVLSQVYQAWKQIALTPGGTEGTFSRVVLLKDETQQFRLIGFTSGRDVDAGGLQLCVFVPNAPNPTQGRMLFVPKDHCRFLQISTEEAFKLILSTGNYIPVEVRQALSPGRENPPVEA